MNLHTWVVSQWMSSGAAAAVEESQTSVRGNIRHTMSRLAQRVSTLQQEGWDALERRIDPMPVNRRPGGLYGRGGGYYAAQGDSDVNNVWESFFNKMMTCMDSALCEGWIVPDDFSEPFIQLGMPAIAIIEIALQSRDNLGVTGLRLIQ